MNYNRIISILLLIVFGVVFAACSEDQPDRFDGPVVWVNDGDTIIVLYEGRKIRIRLFGIDAPEKEQPYSNQALKYAISLAKGKTVRVERLDMDRYGRVVAWVKLPDGRMMNHEMIRAGLAWHYRRYSDDRDLAELEKKAKSAKKGLWRDRRPEAPWDFKMRRRK